MGDPRGFIKEQRETPKRRPVDVRILGVEYQDKDFTGKEECYYRNIEIVFNGRDHSFSSSSLRKRVAESENQKLAIIQKW